MDQYESTGGNPPGEAPKNVTFSSAVERPTGEPSALSERLDRELRAVLYPLIQQDWVTRNFGWRDVAQRAHAAVTSYWTIAPKRCSACERRLGRENFGPNRAKPDGLQSVCRHCRQKRRRA